MDNPIKMDDLGVPLFLETSVLHSLKLTFSPLKNGGWETILSSWGSAYFQGRTGSSWEGICHVSVCLITEGRPHTFVFNH